jgi:hypothetical protein
MADASLVPSRSVVGEWLSLVEHLVRDQGVGGSNPLSPTNLSLILVTFLLARILRYIGTVSNVSKSDASDILGSVLKDLGWPLCNSGE